MTNKITNSQNFAAIAPDKNQRVDGRALHEFLQVKSQFRDWMKNRITKYRLVENVDYFPTAKILAATPQPTVEYSLTVDTAKQLAMVEKTERGRQVRLYYIECEKKLKEVVRSPFTPAGAIQTLAQGYLELQTALQEVQVHATETNSRLEVLEERTAPPDFSDYLTELEVRAKYFPGVNEGRVRELLTAAGVAWSYKTLNNVDVPVAARGGLEDKVQQVLQSIRFAGSHGKWWLFTSPYVLTGKRFAVHEENIAPGVQELWRPIVKKGRDKSAPVVFLQAALDQKTDGFQEFAARVFQYEKGASLDYATFKRVLQNNGFKTHGEQLAFERWLQENQGVEAKGRGGLKTYIGLKLKKQDVSA
jgi:phage anti-repressor protein